MTDQVVTERRGAVLWVTFNRPEARNAMTWAMYDRLDEICREADADRSLRVMVLTGAGGNAFVAGTDISQFREFATERDALDYEEKMDRIMGALESVRVPTIAAIKGPAVGGGATIAACCDLRIGSPSAKFGFPIARTLGNCLSMRNYARLVSLIGVARVKELIFSARLFDAKEMFALGLLNGVSDDEESLLADAAALAEKLCEHAPLTMQVTKAALLRIQRQTVPAESSDLVVKAYTSGDFKEGIEAFFAKRKPHWTGE